MADDSNILRAGSPIKAGDPVEVSSDGLVRPIQIAPPPADTVMCLFAVSYGEFYVAPLGSVLADTDAWRRVHSLGDVADLLGASRDRGELSAFERGLS